MKVMDMSIGKKNNCNRSETMKKKKRMNKILMIAGGVFLGIIFLILVLYFITSYNSTVVYRVSLNNDKFSLTSGVFIKSKMYNVLDLGNLEMKNDEYKRDKFYVELYLEEKFLFATSNINDGIDLEIIERYGYDDSFTKESLKEITDNFKIKIYVHKDYENRQNDICYPTDSDCEVYEYILDVNEIFRNDKLIYLEGPSI